MVPDMAEPGFLGPTLWTAGFREPHRVDGHPGTHLVLGFFAVLTLSGLLPGGGGLLMPRLDTDLVPRRAGGPLKTNGEGLICGARAQRR